MEMNNATPLERGVFVEHTLTRPAAPTRPAVPSGLLCAGLLCASPPKRRFRMTYRMCHAYTNGVQHKRDLFL